MGLAGACLTACVFHAPPPLPEELAAAKAEEEARKAHVRAGTPDAAGGAGQAPVYLPGEEPEIGMTDEELRAYATAQGDPEAGDFTLDEALADLPGTGPLWARMHMADGTQLDCELFPQQAPRTVANFVGLARGLRPFRGNGGGWEKKPYYDGTGFHRVIEGFMIQGGDPTGVGTGNTGYVIADELDDSLRHDRAGVLSMANRGPATGSAQFFITLAPVPHLDGKHTIFGRCTDATVKLAERIATTGGPDDRPKTPQTITRLEIIRG
jgi:peptidyl-prolyl cis-trans isomerase A (cyclophilin A)